MAMPHFMKSALLTVAVLSTAAPAWAQVGEGFANTELNRIRNAAIGNQYSVQDIVARNIGSMSVRNSLTGAGLGGPDVSAVTSLNLGAQPRRQAATFDSFGGGLTSGNKPFSSVSSGPTISPYLNLFRDDLTDDIDNYNTLVRPQVQQQRLNQSFQRETTEISRRVQSIAAKPAFNPQGSQTQSPTGHPTGFMYYSHFYPSAGQRRR